MNFILLGNFIPLILQQFFASCQEEDQRIKSGYNPCGLPGREKGKDHMGPFLPEISKSFQAFRPGINQINAVKFFFFIKIENSGLMPQQVKFCRLRKNCK